MNYQRRDGSQMSKQQALNDTLRRQNEELRYAKTSAERCAIQSRYTAEKKDIMRNYK